MFILWGKPRLIDGLPRCDMPIWHGLVHCRQGPVIKGVTGGQQDRSGFTPIPALPHNHCIFFHFIPCCANSRGRTFDYRRGICSLELLFLVFSSPSSRHVKQWGHIILCPLDAVLGWGLSQQCSIQNILIPWQFEARCEDPVEMQTWTM